ncbi:MAG: HEAT repeat domain-containing protein [Rubripirellula sp.]
MNRPLLIAALLLSPIAVVRADTIEISGGGNLEGVVQRKAGATIITVDDEIQVAVRGKSRVLRVIDSDQLAAYRQMVAKVGNTDAELHYKLGIWCVSKDEKGRRNVPGDSQHYKRYHMERAIALDPDHANARASLGYKKEKGDWVLTSELMRDRGMIKTGSGWELPELVALEESADLTDVDVKKWRREVALLTKNVLRGGQSKRDIKRIQDSMASLKAIKDPLAASAIAFQLKFSREQGNQPQSLRLLWVRLLGSFRNSPSVQALVLAGIAENDETIREAALDSLVEYGSSSAVATYLPLLKPPTDNKTINRAARALTWFPDPELALTYVHALVTTHIEIGPPPAGMNAGFGDQGSSGMSQGGKPTRIERKLMNPAVLTLLKTVETEADYGYDERAWRQYFADKRSKFAGDLRRDP